MRPELIAARDRYPRSSRYDPEWVMSLDMGPHPLWQLEEMWTGIGHRRRSGRVDLAR